MLAPVNDKNARFTEHFVSQHHHFSRHRFRTQLSTPTTQIISNKPKTVCPLSVFLVGTLGAAAGFGVAGIFGATVLGLSSARLWFISARLLSDENQHLL